MYSTVPISAPGSVGLCVLVETFKSSLVGLGLPASFAKPKSRTFAWPWFVTKIFAGLMSRCTIPLEWAVLSETTNAVTLCRLSLDLFSVRTQEQTRSMRRLVDTRSANQENTF